MEGRDAIAVVIPAYNEARTIAATMQELRDSGYSRLIVIDDGSQDDTARIAATYATVLRHVVNRGMGAALATGTTYALRVGAQYVVHFDADGQHDPADIKTLITPLVSNTADIVLGSRYLNNSYVPWSKRYLIHAPARIVERMMTGVVLTDVHNGLRAMNRHAAESISIYQDRMAHNTEIIAQIRALRLRYREVPVRIRYHEYGQGFSGGVKILKDIIVRKLLR